MLEEKRKGNLKRDILDIFKKKDRRERLIFKEKEKAMKVHLIRSDGFKMEDYNHVFNILNQYSGGITFVPSEPIVLPDTDLKSPYEDEDSYGRQALYQARGNFF